jgi:hypothetical protein
MKLIIDAVTGTILNAEGCYIVEEKDILGEDLSDSEISALAERVGKSVQKMGTDTGWGDNSYRYSVSYSPLSLKDEADSLIEGGVFVKEDSAYWALQWAMNEATQEQLEDISSYIMEHDSVWNDFRDNLLEGIMWLYKQTR